MVYQFSINLIFILIIFLFLIYDGTDFSSLFLIENIIILSISSIFVFLGIVTFYVGLFKGNVSVGTVVLSTRVLFAIPLGFLLLGEIFDLIIYIWIIITIIGILLVTWEEGLSLSDVLFFRGGTIYFIVTSIFWAIANAIIRFLNNEVHIVGIIVIRLVILTILMFASFSYLNKNLSSGTPFKFSKRHALLTIYLVIIIMIADFGFIYSIGESLTISESIGALQGLFVFLIIIFTSKISLIKIGLKEKMDKKTLIIRSLGIILATTGTLSIILGIE